MGISTQVNPIWFPLFVLLSVFAISPSAGEKCTFHVIVQTGKATSTPYVKASTVSLTLQDANGNSIAIDNLKDWGVWGPDHHYFESGNFDIFTVNDSACLAGPVCAMTLTSDGSGIPAEWLVEFVEVTTVHSDNVADPEELTFKVDKSLSPKSEDGLSAFVNKCGGNNRVAI